MGHSHASAARLAWSEHTDWFSPHFAIFLIATFVGVFVTGVSGFAFGLIASPLWLYILPPLPTTALIIGFGLVVQVGSNAGISSECASRAILFCLRGT
jgi:uncharacterized membrane protein YfcA